MVERTSLQNSPPTPHTLPRDILVVGSVALDDVETPFGRVEGALGGSATYFATAASFYAPVKLVGVVGDDFPPEHVEFLRRRQVDLAGLEVVEGGRTFRWRGRYEYDLNTAHTLDTQLNVFAEFSPKLPETYRRPGLLFLANIAPELQRAVLEQIERPALVALDTMNFWISSRRDALADVMRLVDVVLINEAEARQFADTYSLLGAARAILALGPKAVIIKKGEYGASMFTDGDHPGETYFFAPAYPLETVKDPTGAGDTFAGGFLGALAREPVLDANAFRRAIVHGSVMASFTVEDFSINRLRALTADEIERRFAEFQAFTRF